MKPHLRPHETAQNAQLSSWEGRRIECFALFHLLMGRVRQVGHVGHFQALNWLGCRTWNCLIASWMRRGRANSQNPLSHLSHVSHMSHLHLASWEASRLAQCFTLRLSKREALKTFFVCFWRPKVLLFVLFQRKRFLEHWFFDIPAAVKGTAGRLTRIGWCGVGQGSLKRMGAGSVPAEAIGRAVYAIPRAEL